MNAITIQFRTEWASKAAVLVHLSRYSQAILFSIQVTCLTSGAYRLNFITIRSHPE